MSLRASGGASRVADILRAAGNVEDERGGSKSSRILDEIVLPALADAERAFTAALAQLNHRRDRAARRRRCATAEE